MAQNISKKFSFIGENIRKIREAKKISQADFAKLFNLARPSVGAYEEGRSEPKIDTLIQIANHFRISIDLLLTRKLTVAEIYSFDQLNKKLDAVHNKREKPADGFLSIPFVSMADYVDYIVKHRNKDYLSGLKQVGCPVELPPGYYMVLEMKGSEMEYEQNGIRNGDLLICRKTSIGQLKHNNHDIVTMVTSDDIITRRLLKSTKNNLEVITDDHSRTETSIPVSEILEIWLAVGAFTSKLNPPTRVEERLSKLEEALKNLEKK